MVMNAINKFKPMDMEIKTSFNKLTYSYYWRKNILATSKCNCTICGADHVLNMKLIRLLFSHYFFP